MKGARSTRPLSGVSGFTLLELAVAAALSAVVLTAAAVVSVRGMTAWRSSDSRLQALSRAEKGLSRLAEELRSAAAPADLPFHGVKEEIGFAKAEDLTRLAEVRYRVIRDAAGSGAWVREWLPFPKAQETAPEVTTLADRVTLFSLEYGAVSDEEGQKVVRWVESWDDPQGGKAIPKIVRVRLEGTDARGRAFAVTRDLWIPHGTLDPAPESG